MDIGNIIDELKLIPLIERQSGFADVYESHEGYSINVCIKR